MKRLLYTLLPISCLFGLAHAQIGYTNTPYIVEGGPWRVHDASRPHPPVVTPGLPSSQEKGGTAPSDAIVLFDGTNTDKWMKAKDKSDCPWKVENGYMEVTPKSGYQITRDEFEGDFQLHVEWQTPPLNGKSSQARGNSGVFIFGKYEIQMLDTFENPSYADGMAGALYGQTPPLANAVGPNQTWQTYDIIWESPVLDGDTLLKPAYVTVILNGIVLHHKKALLGPTTHKKATSYKNAPTKGPISLQDHGNPMRFRNIWLRPLGTYDAAAE